MVFSRQDSWSWLPFPSPGENFPTQGLKPGLQHYRQIFQGLNHQQKREASSRILMTEVRRCELGPAWPLALQHSPSRSPGSAEAGATPLEPWGAEAGVVLKISRMNWEHAIPWLGSVFKIPQGKWELLAGLPTHHFCPQLRNAGSLVPGPALSQPVCCDPLLAPFSSRHPPSPLLLH